MLAGMHKKKGWTLFPPSMILGEAKRGPGA
jgi:hypothetical protein